MALVNIPVTNDLFVLSSIDIPTRSPTKVRMNAKMGNRFAKLAKGEKTIIPLLNFRIMLKRFLDWYVN